LGLSYVAAIVSSVKVRPAREDEPKPPRVSVKTLALSYDADAFIRTLADPQITPVIPSHPRRAIPLPCDFALYCERNLVERFFNKLKRSRAIATRYYKLARNFLAGAHLCSAIILLN
jgi:transposase